MTSASDLPRPHSDRLAPNIAIRFAKSSDAEAMAECFFQSFTPSHKFWSTEFPRSLFFKWWIDAWTMGIEKDPTARTYIALDTTKAGLKDGDKDIVEDGKVVGFGRWIVPQHDNSLHRLWPDLPEGIDTDIMYPFFGGMEENRAKFMTGNPHWFLEMLGTNTSYQCHGVGYTLVKWGCDLADAENMEVYIDASEMGAPFYQKHFGALPKAPIVIPSRPDTWGTFNYVTYIRPKISDRR